MIIILGLRCEKMAMFHPSFNLLWCFSLVLCLFNKGGSIGTDTTVTKRFYEVEKPTNKSWPLENRETEEYRKAKASLICINGGLVGQQKDLCDKFPLQAAAAFRAYRDAVEECQYQFRNERWNCSSLVSMGGRTIQPLGTKLMHRGFKESAFVHALVAAAVAKSVSFDCAKGVMSSCNKLGSMKRRAKKQYSVHDEAITHGLYFSEKFLNSMKSSDDLQGLVHRHNMRAGRMVFTNTLKTMCKCHGLSGSCSTKTCVKTTSGLRVIGNAIKTMFKNAQKVEWENERRARLKLALVNVRKDITDKSTQQDRISPGKSELKYTEVSPSFCNRDDALGISGVSGRICSRDPSHANSCRNLCCGKGYDKFLVTEETDCKCKFLWCCSVRCEKCSQRKLLTRCK